MDEKQPEGAETAVTENEVPKKVEIEPFDGKKTWLGGYRSGFTMSRIYLKFLKNYFRFFLIFENPKKAQDKKYRISPCRVAD